jgi:hypothetical protein
MEVDGEELTVDDIRRFVADLVAAALPSGEIAHRVVDRAAHHQQP